MLNRLHLDNECSMENREDRILYQNASASQMIGNQVSPSSICLQSQPNSYGNTIRDNWISQGYQRPKKVLLIPHNTVESGHSEIVCSNPHIQDNGRDAVAVLLKSNVIGDDYIQAISDEKNSCLNINQNEGLVDKTSRVYMSMNYKPMEQH